MGEFKNPPDEEIAALLRRVRTIAVVGLSPEPSRPSHGVARHLQRFGYRIIPVRPAIESVLGERAYASLREVPHQIDLVDVFRAPEYIDTIVDECLALKLPALWLQQGIINHAAALRAQAAGMTVVMDRCAYLEYVHHFGANPLSSLSV